MIAKIINAVMALVAEAEVRALFLNAQNLLLLRRTCKELGKKQPPTPMRADNSTASGILNKTLKQNRSKEINIRFHWLRYRVKQGQFRIFWDKGTTNLANYFNKFNLLLQV